MNNNRSQSNRIQSVKMESAKMKSANTGYYGQKLYRKHLHLYINEKSQRNNMKQKTSILALASYLPDKKITNQDLEKILDTSNEWIVKRTGIANRHIMTDQDTVTSMAISNCAPLIEIAAKEKRAITSVIVATSTSLTMPSIACQVCNHYDIDNAFAFDVNAACSGFIYALNLANDRIKNHQEDCILVIGVDAMSQIIDWKDRSTAVLFGDGSGAVLLNRSDRSGLVAIKCGSSANGSEMLKTESKNGQSQLTMQGKEVFKYAVEKLFQAASNLLSEHHIDVESIDWIVPHQANIRILQQLMKKLCIPEHKLILTLKNHANTSAASIPLALDSATKSGKIKRGDRLLFLAFGAGFTWGAAILDY